MKFPASFTETTDEKKTETNGKYTTTKVSSTFNNTTYFLGVTMHAPDFEYEEGLENVSLESFANTAGGEITNREPWNYKKQKGVQANIETSEFIIIYKVLIFEKKQIQVVVAYDKGTVQNPKTNTKFFKSLQI